MSGERERGGAPGLGCLVVGEDTALAAGVCAGLQEAGERVARAPAASTREQAEQAVAGVRESIGDIGALVSCPPQLEPASLDELTPAALDAALAASFRSPFLYTQAALRSLRATPHGRLLYVTSTLGITARPGMAHVAAGERAVIALMRAAALEAGPGVTANAVVTGRPTEPGDVADSIRWILRPASAYLTGQVVTAAGVAEFHA